MFDSVIITLQTISGDFSVDLDIPCKETISSLKGKLLEILTILDEQLFASWRDIKLFNEKINRLIDSEETLEEAEIWDGSILIISN